MQPRNHDNRFDGIRKNEIASFRGRTPQKIVYPAFAAVALDEVNVSPRTSIWEMPTLDDA
jgi:hypothetical protein